MKKTLNTLFFATVLLGKTIAQKQDTTKLMVYNLYQGATFDKGLVTRFFINSFNSVWYVNRNVDMQQIVNYRWGFIKPNLGVKLKLENELNLQNELGFFGNKKIRPAIFVGYEFSNFRFINNRIFAGAGLIYTPLMNRGHLFRISLFPLYEFTDYKNLADNNLFRTDLRIRGNHIFKKNLFYAGYDLQAMPSWNKLDYWRFKGNGRVGVNITKIISASLIFDFTYENIVETARPKNIETISLGITISNLTDKNN